MTYNEFMELFKQIEQNGKPESNGNKWIISDEEWCRIEDSGYTKILRHKDKIYTCDWHDDIHEKDAPIKQ